MCRLTVIKTNLLIKIIIKLNICTCSTRFRQSCLFLSKSSISFPVIIWTMLNYQSKAKKIVQILRRMTKQTTWNITHRFEIMNLILIWSSISVWKPKRWNFPSNLWRNDVLKAIVVNRKVDNILQNGWSCIRKLCKNWICENNILENKEFSLKTRIKGQFNAHNNFITILTNCFIFFAE